MYSRHVVALGTGKDGRMRTCKFTSDTIRTTIDRGHSGATRFRTTNVTYYTGDGHGEGTKSRSNVSGLNNVLGVVYVPTVVLFFLMGIFVLIEQLFLFFLFPFLLGPTDVEKNTKMRRRG